ncbi:hypothetical protein H4Q26_005728 [Puccinia striiformis f. sp. tritici PST-130]|nr:hypothetical protein H4Q26_005728 [Puccinia striiformis f. sp. tritici PST-130]
MMPSHLRNGRDLSGEQRRRNVKAGLTNPTGQRPFQRLEGQSPIHGTSSDERPGSEPRSRSDARQLQSHLLSTKIRNVHTGTLTSGPLEGTSSGFTGSRESGAHQQSGTHFSVATDSSSESRQPAAGNVYKHVPCPAINVRSSSTKQQHSSHESCTSSSGVQPRTHQPNAKPNGDDGSMWQLVSRLGSRDDGISAKSVGERENGLQFRTDLHSSSYPSVETNLASKGRNDGLPGSYPGATNGSYSFVKLVSPPRRPEPSGCTDVVPRAEPRPLCRSGLSTNLNPPALPSVQNLTNAQTTNVAANYAPYANQNAMNYPTYTAQNAVNYPAYTAQNVMNYPVHTVQDAVNVQAPNFVPNYVTPSQQIPNQATYEHPRPPQHQQGLPGTSHQAGPISISRPVHRTQRDRFHHNRNEPAAPQPHPPPQQRPTPYPVQHQPGGNSEGSRRRRRNHQPQDNTARVLEVGDVFLRAERILGRMQRVQGRKNAQNRNHQ